MVWAGMYIPVGLILMQFVYILECNLRSWSVSVLGVLGAMCSIQDAAVRAASHYAFLA